MFQKMILVAAVLTAGVAQADSWRFFNFTKKTQAYSTHNGALQAGAALADQILNLQNSTANAWMKGSNCQLKKQYVSINGISVIESYAYDRGQTIPTYTGVVSFKNSKCRVKD